MSLVMVKLNSKNQKLLDRILSNPIKSNINWDDVENLLKALGAEISEGSGSRVRLELNGVLAVFHRPHPRKEIDKGALKSLRKFLTSAGVINEN